MSQLFKSRKVLIAFWTTFLNITLALIAFFLQPQYPDIYTLLTTILTSIDALALVLIASIALEDFAAKRAGMQYCLDTGQYEKVCPCMADEVK